MEGLVEVLANFTSLADSKFERADSSVDQRPDSRGSMQDRDRLYSRCPFERRSHQNDRLEGRRD